MQREIENRQEERQHVKKCNNQYKHDVKWYIEEEVSKYYREPERVHEGTKEAGGEKERTGKRERQQDSAARASSSTSKGLRNVAKCK